VGGPGWFDTEPFDISAKADGPASNDELRRMVQTLLAERFQLKFHRETKEQPVYALVVGKGGPKLQAAKSEGRGVGIGVRGRLNGNGADMKTLASVLADRLSRSVVDRTGLKGFYDFLLTWTPDEVQADDPGPSLSTAIQEQLGLKLESTKAPVEMIVIDHAEKPSNNFEPPAAEQEHALHNVAPQVAVAAKPQSQPAPPVGKPLAFEVASIRPSNSSDRRTLLGGDAGRFTANNVTVKKLIENAYGIKDFQISGGPGWAASDLFDISAKSEDPLKPEDLWRAIQSLLADRFKLVIRRETKQMPVYALVVAKNGPKFKDVKASDPNIADPGGRSDLPSGVRPRFMIVRRGRFTGQGVDMETLAWRLSGFLGRTVLDKTGLKAQYDLKLEWVPDENQIAMFQAMGVPEGNGAPPPDWQGPTLFTALEEQLGLKLDSQKGPVEMFMIERVEKPSDNFEPPIAKQQQALDTIAPQMTVAAKP
jgi:uncharacterized protein (TIGR03435 family)